ncbi:hypothetical protein Fmac_019548 [Flemingia macrophylla]|uniref:Amino acid transporter transmembrane domain-containing protein n=1 Tax=Flemingia macrophylla TaxID=520843 RepID=A0ABD1M8J7_9FABA
MELGDNPFDRHANTLPKFGFKILSLDKVIDKSENDTHTMLPISTSAQEAENQDMLRNHFTTQKMQLLYLSSNQKDYSLKGDATSRLFGIFNAIAIIANTWGSGIIPEIQATLAPPIKGKMLKGLSACYVVLAFTFFSVAISGYWAFGNQAEGLIFSNFIDNNKPLAP